MIVRRAIAASFLSLMLLAQKPPDLAETVPDTPIERTSVSFVQAPVTVFDRSGAIVNGLKPSDFRLFDNGKEQDIHVDVAFQPISLVIVIQKSSRVEAVLPQIQKSGNLIEPLVIGDQGEAAVLAFDHRIQEMQGFTNNPVKIADAFKNIHAGSSSARMIDAVDKAVYMLRSRPASRRRIIMLISETRDQSSEGKFKETLVDAQLSNVTIYTVNISRMVTALTSKPEPPRPDPLPPAAHNLPGGQPNTPTTVENYTRLGNRLEFAPMIKEIYKDAKGLFVDNPSTIFTDQTGGEQYTFYRQRGLEDVIQRISEEIHSQYMISYNPNNKNEGGFHEIDVRLDRPEYRARTRPGYYLASIMR
ncbi:MAG: VWA domain-containing protein [Acidobacteriota bacterium]|nr:VWA domain-containing protein [Acidobacteriota bacterium]